MRRVVLLLAILCYSTLVYGQKSRQAYCEVIVWPYHTRLNATVTFDFGMQTYTTAMLYDNNNQPLRFISALDAVNYLSKRGWRLVSTYYDSFSDRKSAHYVMEKTITNEKQVKEGLVLKQIKLDDIINKFQLPN